VRWWLIEFPTRVADVAAALCRLYFVVALGLTAIVAPLTVIALLILWYGFGIRWGW